MDFPPDELGPLPPLYARWVFEGLGRVPPTEAAATCQDCAMRPPPGSTDRSTQFFHPETKCCSYHPTLPNFSAGALLRESGSGRSRVEARIRGRIGVTPLGILPGRLAQHLYALNPKATFGATPRLRCPYLDDGACTVWRHRNAVCSTWFCKHDRGATSQRVWDAIRGLLSLVERELAVWALTEESFDPASILAHLPTEKKPEWTAADLEERVDDEAYRAVWGDAVGREREVYVACADRVAGLTFAQVLEIAGPELKLRVAVAREALSARDARPQHLGLRPFTVQSATGDEVRLTTYNAYDPCEIPSALLSVLPYFDGRSNAEVIASVRDDLGLDLEADVIQQMVDFALLEPVGSERSSS